MSNTDTTQIRGAGSIIASTLSVLLLVAIFTAMALRRSDEIELKDVLGDLEAVSNPNHGMEILHMEKLTDGRLVALFGQSDDRPPVKEMGEDLGKGMGKDSGKGMGGGGRGGRRGMRGKGGMGEAKPDPNSLWLKVPEGETGQAPWQAALIHVPSRSKAEKTLASEFGRLDFKDLSTLPKSGGSAILDSGHVLWHGFRLPFVRTRHFRMEDKKPVFHDSLRINLTRDQHALVLYIRWHPGHKAEIATARPLLDSWQPVQGD